MAIYNVNAEQAAACTMGPFGTDKLRKGIRVKESA